MRAITVKQPWAWAIAAGGKDVENRTKPDPWRSAVGERLAIHAGKGWDRAAFDFGPLLDLARRCSAERNDGWVFGADLLQYFLPQFHHSGAIIATAVLVDVHHASTCERSWQGRRCSAWALPDVWHLVWDDLERVPATPARGALGLWTADLPAAS